MILNFLTLYFYWVLFMKVLKSLLIILIICSILGSVNFISAEELNNNSSIISDISINDGELLEENICIEEEDTNYLTQSDNVGKLSNDEENYIIYVGQNHTTDGDGSYDNPFANLTLACNNVTGQEKVTVRIFNGTYYMGSQLNFNTQNLNIEGINGEVIIKNLYDYTPTYSDYFAHDLYGEAFGLTSNSASFSISNIIFDASGRTAPFVYNDYSSMGYGIFISYFLPFYGDASSGVFNNCSFIGITGENGLIGSEFNSTFINCLFDVHSNNHRVFMDKPFAKNTKHIFKYCIFNIPSDSLGLATPIYLPCDILFDSVWFGQNSLPDFITPAKGFVIDNGAYVEGYILPVLRYAIFNVTQNYLGNNQYEIIGKLTWNGTEDQDGMENFQPMTVTLTSATGNINSTAILKNGEFRTIYTSTNSNHKITATLDNEDIELEFNSVNITVNAPGINYGDDQNVTITFTQPITANITVTVSNESYRKNYTVEIINKDSIIYTIPDTLKAGTYTLDVNLASNGLYGSNSTELKISKVIIDNFNPVLPGENPKVGDNVTISVELPDGATGNVTVYVNNNPFTKDASTNTEITINGLVAGENKVTVKYSGNDKYENASFEGIITAEKVPINVTNNTIVIDSPTNSNTPSVSLNLSSDATGNLTVTLKDKNYTQVLVNGSATVTITDLASGTYDAVVTYSGDGKYDPITKNITVTVNAIKTSIVAPGVTTTYNVAKTLVVTLKDANGKALSGKKVTVKVGSISKTLTTNGNGQVSVDISSLVPKTYSATIKFAGDEKYAQSTATAKVVVNKAKSKITAKKTTFKAKKKTKKYTITLKAGKKAISKVKVTLKVKGKTYKATTNAKGKATFKITKLTKKGKHNAVIKFKGNKYYKASSKKVKLTIKK